MFFFKSTVLSTERFLFVFFLSTIFFFVFLFSLGTWFNDAWLLRVKTEKRTHEGSQEREHVNWYWQATDLDGDSDDDMQIPER